MAYNADNETREELLSINKNNRGDVLKISKIQKNGSDNFSVDIRDFYTSDDDEILPTKKGIRVKDEQLIDVIGALIKALDVTEVEDLESSIHQIVEDFYNEESTD